MTTSETLFDRLLAYTKGDAYPLHMPGHKRSMEKLPGFLPQWQPLAELAGADITEIDGFDNLHDAAGVLAQINDKAAKLYHAKKAWMSINGSTAGILTMISAAVPFGGKIITARNCHKAVYHAMMLRHLTPVYLCPETTACSLADAVSPEAVTAALEEHPDAAAVLITSPTYDGIEADIAAIAEIVHAYGKQFLVDAAHGAHFGFHPAFPINAIQKGADLAVVSLHKTLPALTQTSLILAGEKASDTLTDSVGRFEAVYQTSSPSYLLMASIDLCLTMLKTQGSGLWETFFTARTRFMTAAGQLKKLRILTEDELSMTAGIALDPGKILIETSGAGISGDALAQLLRSRFLLEAEMAAGNYVTAIMTCADTQEGWDRLAQALLTIDAEQNSRAEEHNRTDDKETPEDTSYVSHYPVPVVVMPLWEAGEAAAISCPLEQARGQICASFINRYPPGIPIAAPGELLTEDICSVIAQCDSMGVELQGVMKRDGQIMILTTQQ